MAVRQLTGLKNWNHTSCSTAGFPRSRPIPAVANFRTSWSVVYVALLFRVLVSCPLFLRVTFLVLC